MGCFLGCFGGAKEQRRRKQRIDRASPQAHRRRVQNVQQECVISAEQTIKETPPPSNLVSELRNKPEAEEEPSPSPRKRVTFNSNVTTYEHVSINESIDSLPDCNTNREEEKKQDLKQPSQSHSLSEDDSSVISSVGSYPPNHRYHNAIEGDDEYEEYGDSDMDDLDDFDDEDDYEDYDEEDDDNITGQEYWSKSVVTSSRESRTGNSSGQEVDEEVESSILNAHRSDEEVKAFLRTKTSVRDRSDYVNSVLNPIENVTQWKAVKSKMAQPLKPQKENLNVETPSMSFSAEPTFRHKLSSSKSKSDEVKNPYQEIAVNASLSNWLAPRS